MGNIVLGEKPRADQRHPDANEKGRMTGRQEDAAIITHLLRRQGEYLEVQRMGGSSRKDAQDGGENRAGGMDQVPLIIEEPGEY